MSPLGHTRRMYAQANLTGGLILFKLILRSDGIIVAKYFLHTKCRQIFDLDPTKDMKLIPLTISTQI